MAAREDASLLSLRERKMKTTDALVESEQFQDFLYAIQRSEPIAPCPYCGWACVVKMTIPEFAQPEPGEAVEVPTIRSIDCPNCKRATEFAVNYMEEEGAIQ